MEQKFPKDDTSLVGFREKYPLDIYPINIAHWEYPKIPVWHAFKDAYSTYEFWKSNPVVFEVIDRGPTKLLFDIDRTWQKEELPDINSLRARMWLFVYEVVSWACTILEIYIEKTSIMIMPSDDPHNQKFSVHILIDILLPSLEHCNYIHEFVRDRCDLQLKKYIDPSVYKTLQQMRCLGKVKPYDPDRIKRLVESHDHLGTIVSYKRTNYTRPHGMNDVDYKSYQEFLDSLIHPLVDTGRIVMNTNYTPKEVRYKPMVQFDPTNLGDIAIKKYCDEMKIEMENCPFRVSNIFDNMIILQRTSPSHCPMCKRVHDNIDPYMYIKIEGNVKYLMFACRRAQDAKIRFWVSLGEIDVPIIEEIKGNPPTQAKEESIDNTRQVKQKSKTISQIFEDIKLKEFPFGQKMSKNILDKISIGCKDMAMTNDDYVNTIKSGRMKEILKDFGSVQAIRSPCGTGKTKAIVSCIDELQGAIPIVIVTYRKSLAGKLLNDLQKMGFKSYEEFKDDPHICYYRIIIQIDSLHKLTGHYDILILDEITYTFNHLFDFVKEKNTVAAILREYVIRTPYVVALDATLSEGTIQFLKDNGRTVSIIDNQYKSLSNSKLALLQYKEMVVNEITNRLSRGEKLYLCTNSKKFADTLFAMFSGKYRVAIYSSDSKHSSINGVKEEDWKNFDLVIVTPTVEVGISVEYKHFNATFGYFTSRSSNAYSAFQQMQRVRNLSDSTYYLCVKQATKSRIPIDVLEDDKKLSDWIVSNGEGLSKIIADLKVFGMIIPSIRRFDTSDPYFGPLKEYVQRLEMSKHDFMSEILSLFKYTGISFQGWFRGIMDTRERLQLEHIFNDITREITAIQVRAIANAQDIDAPTYYHLRKKYPLDDDQLASTRKYRLAKKLRLESKQLTENIVTAYRNKGQHCDMLNRLIPLTLCRTQQEVKKKLASVIIEYERLKADLHIKRWGPIGYVKPEGKYDSKGKHNDEGGVASVYVSPVMSELNKHILEVRTRVARLKNITSCLHVLGFMHMFDTSEIKADTKLLCKHMNDEANEFKLCWSGNKKECKDGLYALRSLNGLMESELGLKVSKIKHNKDGKYKIIGMEVWDIAKGNLTSAGGGSLMCGLSLSAKMGV